MVFTNLCICVLWTKVASAFEGLISFVCVEVTVVKVEALETRNVSHS